MDNRSYDVLKYTFGWWAFFYWLLVTDAQATVSKH